MKKVLFALVCSAVLFGCGGNKADVVRIGIFEPASGDNGAGGKQETMGAIYANEVIPTVNVGGKEYKIELVIVDNESSTDKAVTAASELVSKGVSVVLGSYGSGVSIAASDTFASAGIPAIGVTCTNPQVTLGNDHYFRICFLDPFQGTVLANFAIDNYNAKKAYVIAKLGDDYSVGLANYFVEAFKRLGGEVVYETFPEGTSDFAAYVANAKNSGADVFCAPVSTEAAALIIDQANIQRLNLPMLAGDTWDSNVILGAASGKNVDINVTTFFSEGSTDETVVKFVEDFRSWISREPSRLVDNGGNNIIAANPVMAYDAYNVALEAMKIAGSIKGPDILAALPKVSYRGITGLIEFDDIGDAKRDVAYVKHANTQNSSWEFVAIQSVK